MPKRTYPVETVVDCLSRYRAGETICSIMALHNVPRSTVYHWLKKYRDIQNPGDIRLKSELYNLRRKYEKLEKICNVLKRVNCSPSSPLQIRLHEMEALYRKFPVHVLCEALGVSRGTFYNHILRNKRQNSSYIKRRNELGPVIQSIYEESRGLFGSDKILAILKSRGYHTSKKMVLELMKELGLKSLRTRAKKDHAAWQKFQEPQDLLQRNFRTDAPNRAWVSDITQFVLFGKPHYLCAIMDLFSRKIIAYKTSHTASTQLITATFKKAIENRSPDAQLILHSDRGCQYTSNAFRKLLMDHRIEQSFSRAGNPYDNGAMESFFSSFKQEEIYRTSYRSVDECMKRIDQYMCFYNSVRPHRANNYKTPDQTEQIYYEKTA